jgi:predicted flap endonuclease-1-like 5' DNA nuclease
MDKRQLLGGAVVMTALMPPLQESEGLLGIPWWVWLVVITILLILLLIGLVMKQEPGPPVESKHVRPFPEVKAAAPAEVAEPEPVAAEAETAPEELPTRSGAAVVAEEEPTPEQPAAEPEPEPEPEAAAEADDLKRIEGIGPKVAGLLQEAGIQTFAQLAAADPDRLREILSAADLPFIDPGSWSEQAQLAADGNWEEFDKLTDSLKGGRRV